MQWGVSVREMKVIRETKSGKADEPGGVYEELLKVVNDDDLSLLVSI